MYTNFNDYTKDAIRTESARNPLTDDVVFRGMSHRLFHAILGIETEINEIYSALDGEFYDNVNLCEEAGDIAWYLAVANDDLGTLTFRKDIFWGSIKDLNDAASQLRNASADLLDHSKKVLFYGKQIDNDLVKTSFETLFTVLCKFVELCEGNFEQVLQVNINKLKARFPEEFNEVSAEVRDLNIERAVLEAGLSK